MQDFDVTLKPGEVRRIDMQADYIYYRAGDAGGADAAIEFSPLSGGESVFLYPGQAYRVPKPAGGMGYGWALKNRKGEATIIGVVIIGEGEFQDNRISGSVEVIDGGKNRTMAGGAFIAVQQCVANAGQYPHVQLFNPSLNRRLIVKQAFMSSSAAQQLLMLYYHTPLWVPGTGTTNKLPGGVESVAQTRSQSHVELLSSGGMFAPFLGANGNFNLLLTEPIILNPGCGLMVRGGALASVITASFEYTEEAL